MLVALLIVPLLAISGLVIDLGYLYWNQRALQSSADAAALARNRQLPETAKAESVARNGTVLGWWRRTTTPAWVSVDEWITSKCLDVDPRAATP